MPDDLFSDLGVLIGKALGGLTGGAVAPIGDVANLLQKLASLPGEYRASMDPRIRYRHDLMFLYGLEAIVYSGLTAAYPEIKRPGPLPEEPDK